MASADLDSTPVDGVDVPALGAGSGSSCLRVGAKWHGHFLVERELAASGGGMVFAGQRIEDGVAVRFRRLAASADSETRRAVWQVLQDRPLSGGPVLLESVVEDDGRIEVWEAVDGPTLEERLATAKLVTADVAEIVRPLSCAIAELHERGLVYLQLGAERVVLVDAVMEHARLSRVELCVPVDAGGGLVPVPTDVTRTPPEGQGLYRMKADEHLKAWDWWTLGRLIQELWLGGTVMAHALGRDLPRSAEQVRKRAEQMLKEENAKDPRAGGVELMTDLPVQVRTLLRGLLTSVREARWGAREVQRWLEGEMPVERYDLPRATVLIPFHGEQLTVAETALRLLQPCHWREGLGWWAAENPPPDSLPAVLVNTRAALHREREWLESVRELQEATAITAFPVEVRHEILSALAWTGIAGGKTKFRWRGEEVSPELAAQVLAEAGGLTRLEALLSRAVVTLVKRVDANTAWILDTWTRQIEDVKALAARHRWVKTDHQTVARLVAMALSDVATLDHRFAEARLKYRFSHDEEIQALFGSLKPTPSMLVVLALSFENPKACGYVTHEEWRGMELARLRARGERLTEALAMVRLASLLRTGLPVFGSPLVWGVGLGFLMVVAAPFWPGWIGLGAMIALGAGLLGLRRLLKPLVQAQSATGTDGGWSWAAAPGLCTRRARDVLEGGLVPASRLRQMVDRVNEDMGKLGIDPPPEAVQARPMDERLTYAAWGSWAVLGLVLTSLSWQAFRPEWNLAWSGNVWRQELAGLAVRLGLAEAPASEVEVIKIDWPYVQTVEARGVTFEEREGATIEQRAQVDAFIAEVQRLYLPQTLVGIVAINVSAAGVGSAELMLIDVGSGKPFNGFLYEMNYVPLHGTWMKMANRDVVFLSRP